MKILEVKNVTKKFRADFYKKPQQILKGVNLTVEAGQFVGFIGPNGAGKTTTIKCVMEFIFPDSGEVFFFGEKFKLEHRSKIGFLPERPFFQEFLTGTEFLQLHWNLSGKPDDDFAKRSAEVFEQVRLTHAKDKKLKEYSKGMLQRIGIAQALIAEPEFLILDEPMSGLDPDGRILIKQILRSLKEKKMTILMSSHLLEDVEELCDQLIIVHSGVVEYCGPTAEFSKNSANLEEAYKKFKNNLTENLNA